MQALSEGQLVCIDQPQLLEHIFLSCRDTSTQAALLRTSKAWAAAGKRWPPVEVSVELSGSKWWLLGRQPMDDAQVEPVRLPGCGLPAAVAWLAWQRCLIAQLSLRLDPRAYQAMLRRAGVEPSPLPDANVLQDQAAAVVAAAAPRLLNLSVHSELDVWWLPRMGALTHLSLDFGWEPREYDDGRGPLDCIAAAAPHLLSLDLDTSLAEEDEYDPPFLSAGAALPPSLTRLRISGQVAGLGPHLSQLERLGWYPRERSPWLRFPADAVEGLCQASRLTTLVLAAPSPSNVFAFFESHACLTGLRSLSIHRPGQYGWWTLLDRRYYRDAEDYELVVGHLLPSTLAQLTALTSLCLVGHGLRACPATVAHLPALKQLNLSINEGLRELPREPWPALERLDADQELIQAALADLPAHAAAQHLAEAAEGSSVTPLGASTAPTEGSAVAEPGAPEAGHALWSLTRLTHLGGLWQREMEEVEEEEMKQAIRRLLPQLLSIS